MADEKPTIKDEVRSIANTVKKSLTLDKASGVFSVEGDPYKDTLPDDLTMKTVISVHDHDANFVAGSTLAFGELSIEAMSKDKKLTQTEVHIPTDRRNMVDITMDRHRSYTDRMTDPANPKPVEKYGVINASFDFKPGKNTGQVKQVREMLGEAAEKAFK